VTQTRAHLPPSIAPATYTTARRQPQTIATRSLSRCRHWCNAWRSWRSTLGASIEHGAARGRRRMAPYSARRSSSWHRESDAFEGARTPVALHRQKRDDDGHTTSALRSRRRTRWTEVTLNPPSGGDRRRDRPVRRTLRHAALSSAGRPDWPLRSSEVRARKAPQIWARSRVRRRVAVNSRARIGIHRLDENAIAADLDERTQASATVPVAAGSRPDGPVDSSDLQRVIGTIRPSRAGGSDRVGVRSSSVVGRARPTRVAVARWRRNPAPDVHPGRGCRGHQSRVRQQGQGEPEACCPARHFRQASARWLIPPVRYSSRAGFA